MDLLVHRTLVVTAVSTVMRDGPRIHALHVQTVVILATSMILSMVGAALILYVLTEVLHVLWIFLRSLMLYLCCILVLVFQ